MTEAERAKGLVERLEHRLKFEGTLNPTELTAALSALLYYARDLEARIATMEKKR